MGGAWAPGCQAGRQSCDQVAKQLSALTRAPRPLSWIARQPRRLLPTVAARQLHRLVSRLLTPAAP